MGIRFNARPTGATNRPGIALVKIGFLRFWRHGDFSGTGSGFRWEPVPSTPASSPAAARPPSAAAAPDRQCPFHLVSEHEPPQFLQTGFWRFPAGCVSAGNRDPVGKIKFLMMNEHESQASRAGHRPGQPCPSCPDRNWLRRPGHRRNSPRRFRGSSRPRPWRKTEAPAPCACAPAPGDNSGFPEVVEKRKPLMTEHKVLDRGKQNLFGFPAHLGLYDIIRQPKRNWISS
ncbi:MAG: hypothetical protein MZV64_02715 [Ignavibacteriales bacterium]|nr:hypothetical protein [Ignavibacteriales bacterium]